MGRHRKILTKILGIIIGWVRVSPLPWRRLVRIVVCLWIGYASIEDVLLVFEVLSKIITPVVRFIVMMVVIVVIVGIMLVMVMMIVMVI